jgi:hypothetical protein
MENASDTYARWIALFPLMNPTTSDSAYLGGIEIKTWTFCSPMKS